jgi:hypothetical protein
MNDFHHAQKGRSLPGILSTAVTMALCLGFLLSGIRLFQVFGWGLLILVVSGLYSILMGEKWELGVKGSTLYWRYPRWPKSSGSINLELVNTVEINVNTG